MVPGWLGVHAEKRERGQQPRAARYHNSFLRLLPRRIIPMIPLTRQSGLSSPSRAQRFPREDAHGKPVFVIVMADCNSDGSQPTKLLTCSIKSRCCLEKSLGSVFGDAVLSCARSASSWRWCWSRVDPPKPRLDSLLSTPCLLCCRPFPMIPSDWVLRPKTRITSAKGPLPLSKKLSRGKA